METEWVRKKEWMQDERVEGISHQGQRPERRVDSSRKGVRGIFPAVNSLCTSIDSPAVCGDSAAESDGLFDMTRSIDGN